MIFGKICQKSCPLNWLKFPEIFVERFFDQFLGVIEKRDCCFHRISLKK